ncbi:MAG: winged helix-turn-helix transcriptional regulator [Chloroflexi bacterium]|nr:MAG: winged helix-turn-helix transcriptional regulator [Chloroflexota bacterium]TME21872.1 MAG: winged helix-turn-helix transcriptional regulator [Chloroflexota bacterium]
MAPQLAVRDPLLALSSPRRREIVRLVWSDERSAGEIARAFEVTWPAISQNLRVLKDAGLIKERRVGTSRLYRADRAALRPLESYLRSMWSRNIDRLRLLAEAEERRKSKR